MARIRRLLADVSGTLDAKLGNVIASLDEHQRQFTSEGWSDLELDVSSSGEWGLEAEIYGYREETAQEMADREHHAAVSRNMREQMERQQYEALKAKYGA